VIVIVAILKPIIVQGNTELKY